MKYLMNTYNGMALAVVKDGDHLKDGLSVTYVKEGGEYTGVIQESFSKWSTKYRNDENESLRLRPQEENGEIYFYL